MQKETLQFEQNARRVYTAVRRIFERKIGMSGVRCNDQLFTIEARHGAWLSPFSEKVRVKVVATSTQTSEVRIESESRSLLNLAFLGSNKANVSNLQDYIRNEVYKLCSDEEIKLKPHPLTPGLTPSPLPEREGSD